MLGVSNSQRDDRCSFFYKVISNNYQIGHFLKCVCDLLNVRFLKTSHKLLSQNLSGSSVQVGKREVKQEGQMFLPRLRMAVGGRDLCVHLAQSLLQQRLPEQDVQKTAEDLVRTPQSLLQER